MELCVALKSRQRALRLLANQAFDNMVRTSPRPYGERLAQVLNLAPIIYTELTV